MERAFQDTSREGFDLHHTKNQFQTTSKNDLFLKTTKYSTVEEALKPSNMDVIGTGLVSMTDF